jgi:hypothetical protein
VDRSSLEVIEREDKTEVARTFSVIMTHRRTASETCGAGLYLFLLIFASSILMEPHHLCNLCSSDYDLAFQIVSRHKLDIMCAHAAAILVPLC